MTMNKLIKFLYLKFHLSKIKVRMLSALFTLQGCGRETRTVENPSVKRYLLPPLNQPVDKAIKHPRSAVGTGRSRDKTTGLKQSINVLSTSEFSKSN